MGTTDTLTCPYQMIPRNYPVWDCRLEKDHEGWHHPRQSMQEIKDTYLSEGKLGHKKHAEVKILEPGHEVDIDTVVSRTKKGVISKNTTMGKVISAVLDWNLMNHEDSWAMKYGKSVAQEEGKDPETWLWVEGMRGKLWFRVTGTDCNWRGWTVTASELVDAIVNGKEEIPMRAYIPKVLKEEKGYE